MNRIVLRIWFHAILWLVVIGLESTSLGSTAHTSILVLPLLRFLFPHAAPSQLTFAHDFIRKLGHFVGYGILSLLMFRAWWASLSLPRSARRLPSWLTMLRAWSLRAAALAWLSTAAVASLDEWHQTFLPGRTGELHDVILDSSAALCVQLLLIAFSDAHGKQIAVSF